MPYFFRVEDAHNSDGYRIHEQGSREATVLAAYRWARDRFGEPSERGADDPDARWFYSDRTDIMYFRSEDDAFEFKLRWG